MFTKDPKYVWRERILLGIFILLVALGIVFRNEIGRRLLVWRVYKAGGMAGIEEIAARGPDMIPYFEKHLADKDPQVRLRFILALKAMQHPACYGTFERMSRSRLVDLRQYGLDGMVELNGLHLYPRLVEALSDPEEPVRRTATRGLLEMTGESFGYRPGTSTEEERLAAIEKWKEWLDREGE
jgi:hypothetical protein